MNKLRRIRIRHTIERFVSRSPYDPVLITVQKKFSATDQLTKSQLTELEDSVDKFIREGDQEGYSTLDKVVAADMKTVLDKLLHFLEDHREEIVDLILTVLRIAISFSAQAPAEKEVGPALANGAQYPMGQVLAYATVAGSFSPDYVKVVGWSYKEKIYFIQSLGGGGVRFVRIDEPHNNVYPIDDIVMS